MATFLFLALLPAAIAAIIIAGHFNHEQRMATTPAALLATLGIAAAVGAGLAALKHATEVGSGDFVGPMIAGIVVLVSGPALGAWVIRHIIGRHTAEVQMRREDLASVIRSHKPKSYGEAHE
jgi:hypothetical protein